jgi:hypothetical protein
VQAFTGGRRYRFACKARSCKVVARYRQKIIKTVVFIAAAGCLINNAPALLANTCSFSPTKEISNMKNTALRASALALIVAMAAGCATTGLDEVKATAERAAADAAAAASAAEAARASADRASQAASAAQSTADRAMSAATGSQACCDANRESMERMFKKTMSK